MNVRNASAVWKGNLKEGSGELKLSSTGYQTPYNFASRFGDGRGTNPEELIGAAHAACYSMAFSDMLAKEGYKPLEVSTKASVTLDFIDGRPTITKIHLETEGIVDGINNDAFMKLAGDAGKNCPVSRLLKAAEITLDARLKS